MDKAYWNEPLPLKKPYPAEHSQLKNLMAAIGFVFFLIAGARLLPDAMTYPSSRPLRAFLVVLVIPASLSFLMLWGMLRVDGIFRMRVWKSAFILNNADLHIDYAAVERTIHYLRSTTAYGDADFKRVVTSLACSLRWVRPFARSTHTNFSWEALHAYQHYAKGDKEIQPTSCPR